jgi:hypothetical protein
MTEMLEPMLNEFREEAAITKRVLARVPAALNRRDRSGEAEDAEGSVSVCRGWCPGDSYASRTSSL